MRNNAALASSLERLAEAMDGARDPWWIIGSAAVLLHGGEPGEIADIDVLLSVRDLYAIYARLPLSDTREAGKPMFRSEKFGRWEDLPLAVEFMAGLNLWEGGAWQPVIPETLQAIPLGERTLYLPEKPELIALLHRFGREKDLERAAMLVSN